MEHATVTLSTVQPARRTITRAAAWTLPVIAAAAAAPAYAASCRPRVGQVLDWDGANVVYTRTSATEAYAELDPDGSAGPLPVLRLDVKATYVGNMRAGTEGGDTSQTMVRQASVGGLGVSGIGLMQATTSSSPNTPAGATRGYGDRGTYTFTFNRPVSNLVLTITDVDSAANDFRDALTISAGFVVESQAAGIDTITGSADTPNNWYATSDNDAPVDDTNGSGGNMRIKFAGPISTFSITYWNRARDYDRTTDTNQRVFVSDLTFDYKPC